MTLCNTSTLLKEVSLTKGVSTKVTFGTSRYEVVDLVPNGPVDSVKPNSIIGRTTIETWGPLKRSKRLKRQVEGYAPLGRRTLVVVEPSGQFLSTTSIACWDFTTGIFCQGFPLSTHLTNPPGDPVDYGQALLVWVFTKARCGAIDTCPLLQPFQLDMVFDTKELSATSTTSQGNSVFSFTPFKDRWCPYKVLISEHALPSSVIRCGSNTSGDEVAICVSVFHCIADGAARDNISQGVPNDVVDPVKANSIDVIPAIVTRFPPERHVLPERQFKRVPPFLSKPFALLVLGFGRLPPTRSTHLGPARVWELREWEWKGTPPAFSNKYPAVFNETQFVEVLPSTRHSTEDAYLPPNHGKPDVISVFECQGTASGTVQRNLVSMRVPRKEPKVLFDLSVCHSHTSPLLMSLYNLV